jgi:hypothetical protein
VTRYGDPREPVRADPEKEAAMAAPGGTPRNTDPPPRESRTTAAKAWAAALYSAVLAFLSSLLTALGGADTGWESVTAGQWLTAVLSALVAFGGAAGLTYYVPNRPR